MKVKRNCLGWGEQKKQGRWGEKGESGEMEPCGQHVLPTYMCYSVTHALLMKTQGKRSGQIRKTKTKLGGKHPAHGRWGFAGKSEEEAGVSDGELCSLPEADQLCLDSL